AGAIHPGSISWPIVLTIRDAIAQGYRDLFGETRANGRTLRVDEVIETLTRRFAPDFEKVLAARREFLSQVAAGRARYGFADPSYEVEDADGNRSTAARIRQGMIDNVLGTNSPDRWSLNARVPAPAEVLRPGLQGTGPCDDLGMAISALNAGRAGAVSWM